MAADPVCNVVNAPEDTSVVAGATTVPSPEYSSRAAKLPVPAAVTAGTVTVDVATEADTYVPDAVAVAAPVTAVPTPDDVPGGEL